MVSSRQIITTEDIEAWKRARKLHGSVREGNPFTNMNLLPIFTIIQHRLLDVDENIEF